MVYIQRRGVLHNNEERSSKSLATLHTTRSFSFAGAEERRASAPRPSPPTRLRLFNMMVSTRAPRARRHAYLGLPGSKLP